MSENFRIFTCPTFDCGWIMWCSLIGDAGTVISCEVCGGKVRVDVKPKREMRGINKG